MPEYVRPHIPERTFRDASGRVVEYGHRWPDGDGPEDTYEVVSHPERFAPLHDVADALVAHLVETFDVDVMPTRDLARPRAVEEPARRIRLVPAAAGAASLTFVFTDFPSVVVEAGLMTDFVLPSCGCDHCDETAEACAEDMEQHVFAVVEGGFREGLTSDLPPIRSMEIASSDAELHESGWGPDAHLTPDQVRSVRGTLSVMDGHWAAWTARSTNA